jgi:hypothetical protein
VENNVENILYLFRMAQNAYSFVIDAGLSANNTTDQLLWPAKSILGSRIGDKKAEAFQKGIITVNYFVLKFL